MKKYISIIIVVVCIGLVIFGVFSKNEQEYIRIHVRANSNLEVDQEIKYKIKDDIVSYLIPIFCECSSRDDFINAINNNIPNLEKIADNILNENGFLYTSNVKFCKESFPTRSYDGVVLKSGIYDSLIVELGSAKGNNWWCVVYPPLCFISNNSQDILYKSRILEILKSILK